MLQLFRRKTPRLLGLDMTMSSIKLIELAKNSQGYEVTCFGSEALFGPLDTPNGEPEIQSLEPYVNALTRLIEKSRPTTQHAAIALSDSHVLTHVITVPSDLDEHEAEEKIRVESKKNFPFSLTDFYWDFHPMGPSITDPFATDMLVVATERKNIDTRLTILNQAGITAEVVDIASHAIKRCSELMNQNGLCFSPALQSPMCDSFFLACGLALRGF